MYLVSGVVEWLFGGGFDWICFFVVVGVVGLMS